MILKEIPITPQWQEKLFLQTKPLTSHLKLQCSHIISDIKYIPQFDERNHYFNDFQFQGHVYSDLSFKNYHAKF